MYVRLSSLTPKVRLESLAYPPDPDAMPTVLRDRVRAVRRAGSQRLAGGGACPALFGGGGDRGGRPARRRRGVCRGRLGRDLGRPARPRRGMGQANGSPHVRVEDLAVNLDDFGRARQRRARVASDADRPRRPGRPPRRGRDRARPGPRSAGGGSRSSTRSRRAGTCATTCITNSCTGGERRPRTWASLFVHVPLLPEQVPAGRWVPSLARADQVGRAGAAIRACLGVPPF